MVSCQVLVLLPSSFIPVLSLLKCSPVIILVTHLQRYSTSPLTLRPVGWSRRIGMDVGFEEKCLDVCAVCTWEHTIAQCTVTQNKLRFVIHSKYLIVQTQSCHQPSWNVPEVIHHFRAAGNPVQVLSKIWRALHSTWLLPLVSIPELRGGRHWPQVFVTSPNRAQRCSHPQTSQLPPQMVSFSYHRQPGLKLGVTPSP